VNAIGMYPNNIDHFRVQGIENMYAIGDCGGVVRGLVPSMLTGYALAHTLAQQSKVLFVSENEEKIFEIRAALGMLPTKTFDSTNITINNIGNFLLLPSISECISNNPLEVANSKALFALKEFNVMEKSVSNQNDTKRSLFTKTLSEIAYLLVRNIFQLHHSSVFPLYNIFF
jgi:hypothetical protein